MKAGGIRDLKAFQMISRSLWQFSSNTKNLIILKIRHYR